MFDDKEGNDVPVRLAICYILHPNKYIHIIQTYIHNKYVYICVCVYYIGVL